MAVNARCSFLEVPEYIQVCRTMLTMIKTPLIKAFKINKASVSVSSQRPFPCREKGLPHGGRSGSHPSLLFVFPGLRPATYNSGSSSSGFTSLHGSKFFQGMS